MIICLIVWCIFFVVFMCLMPISLTYVSVLKNIFQFKLCWLWKPLPNSAKKTCPLCVDVSVCLYGGCLSVCPYVNCLSVCPSVHPSVCSSVCLFNHLYVCPFVRLYVSLSFCLSIHLSVGLYVGKKDKQKEKQIFT